MKTNVLPITPRQSNAAKLGGNTPTQHETVLRFVPSPSPIRRELSGLKSGSIELKGFNNTKKLDPYRNSVFALPGFVSYVTLLLFVVMHCNVLMLLFAFFY